MLSFYPHMLKKYAYCGIDKVIKRTHQIAFQVTGQYHQKPIRDNLYAVPCTHEILLPQTTWSENFRTARQHKISSFTAQETVVRGVDFSNPNQDVAIVLWSKTRLLGRYPGSVFFYHDETLYHTLTWTDVLGPKHMRENRCAKVIKNRLHIYAVERTPEETAAIIELFHNEQPPLAEFK